MSIQFRFQAHKNITIGYAADGYARIRGISVIATTLGVGELSAINAIAGSSAELVPVIHIVGYPSTTAMDKGDLLHHTLADGDFGRFAKMSEQISSAVVILKDKSTASKRIDETITECYRSSKPVYIGFPMDLVQAEVDPSPLERPLVLEEPASNPKAVEENVVNMVLDRILRAQNPIIIVDSLGGKPQILKSTRSLVEKSGLPCFIMPMAKGIVDESLINYRGVYAERISESGVFEQVQLSDLILVIGPRPTDLNTGGFRTDMPHIETIKFGRDTVEMRGQEVATLEMSGVLTKLSDTLDGRMSPSNSSASTPARKLSVTSERDNSVSSASTPSKGSIHWDHALEFQGGILDKSSPLTQEWVWQRISTWLEEDDIIAADVGTSLFGTTWTRYPRGVVLLSQYLWCSIGYAVGAAVGAAIAAREDEQKSNAFRRRTILLTGDGSLQMTAQEVSTMVRRNLPIIMFVVNNEGYTVERMVHGEDQEYNDIQPWDYKLLPTVFQAAPDTVRTYDVRTRAELDMLLADPQFGPAENFDEKNPAPLRLVELHMPKDDAPVSLRGMIDAITRRK
jgi:pyruvate decarboxylase